MKVYIIVGKSGEYSDRTEWPVAAYLDRALAERHVELASLEARAIYAEYTHYPPKGKWCHPTHRANGYDPGMVFVMMGADYYIAEAELRDAAP